MADTRLSQDRIIRGTPDWAGPEKRALFDGMRERDRPGRVTDVLFHMMVAGVAGAGIGMVFARWWMLGTP